MLTTASSFLTKEEAFNELLALKFAVASLAQMQTRFSYEGELAKNAAQGIKYRIDYLHDSFSMLMEKK